MFDGASLAVIFGADAISDIGRRDRLLIAAMQFSISDRCAKYTKLAIAAQQKRVQKIWAKYHRLTRREGERKWEWRERSDAVHRKCREATEIAKAQFIERYPWLDALEECIAFERPLFNVETRSLWLVHQAIQKRAKAERRREVIAGWISREEARLARDHRLAKASIEAAWKIHRQIAKQLQEMK